MLSPLSQWLTRLVAVLFAELGLVLFLAPDWAAANFLWRVSPFVAMSMGGWYLGGALLAWEGARQWPWSLSHPRLLYLWAFGLLEIGVLGLHSTALRSDALLFWPYLAVLAVAAATALIGVVDCLRLRPANEPLGRGVPRFVRAGILFFIVFVGLLAAVAAWGPRLAINGTIFPEPLTLFTVRAFGAFYLALGLGALPLLWARGLQPVLAYAWSGSALIVPILIATGWYWRQFDIADRPGGLIYVGAYVGALIYAVILIVWHQTRSGRAAPPVVTAEPAIGR